MPKRPTFATAICIYEILIGVCGLCYQLAMQFFVFQTAQRRGSTFATAAQHNILISTGFVLGSVLLSFGIAFFVWRLHPLSFVLSLIKVLLGIFTNISVLYVMYKHGIFSSELAKSPAFIISFWVPRAVDALFVLISIAITVYLFSLTVKSRSSNQGFAQ